VPYYVQFAPAVRDYLASVEGLSDDARAQIVDAVIDELGRDADKFLALYPLGPDSLHFRYDYPHPDGATLFVFDFVVDGSRMEVGVVTVVYAECTAHRAP
jgi:hypothetical protein